MKNDKRPHSHNHDSQPVIRTNAYQEPTENDPEDLKNDEWHPSLAQFEAFLVRDFSLAQSNIASAMSSRGLPMSLKELKDSTLHSTDCIERVLTSKMASGLVTENSGKYGLVR